MPGIAIATASKGGSPTYLGYLVTRRDEGENPVLLESLRGKRVAWVNRSSTSGYLYPRAMLQSKNIQADAFFASPPVFAGNHKKALQMVIDGEVDVAAVAAPFVDPGRGRAPVDDLATRGTLAVVAKTSRIPLDCIVVHKKLQRTLADRFRSALLALINDAEASRTLAASWGINGFVAADDRRYDEIDSVLRAQRESATQDPPAK
jgi:phosphate/phosphite/phosphonate ABC transporter binding protein